MKKLNILLLIPMFTLIACVPQEKETIREVPVYQGGGGSEIPAPPVSNVGGVDDGGGGNGLNGKPLESYSVDIRTLPEFSEIVVPLIEQLKSVSPNLASDFAYIATERSWYLVPVKLNQIPQATIGTFFKTDQLAIQNAYEVWIDEDLYSQMTVEAKAKLIVHELLMGVRILDQLSTLEKCLASTSLIELKSERSFARSSCYKKYPKVGLNSSVGIRVSKDHYALIRKLTNIIFNDELRNSINIEEELFNNKFRTY